MLGHTGLVVWNFKLWDCKSAQLAQPKPSLLFAACLLSNMPQQAGCSA